MVLEMPSYPHMRRLIESQEQVIDVILIGSRVERARGDPMLLIVDHVNTLIPVALPARLSGEKSGTFAGAKA